MANMVNHMAGKLILLVEDNADDEALSLRALRSCRVEHAVVVARDGEQALKLLADFEGPGDANSGMQPALVLLDLKLPKLDGAEVLRSLRADTRTADIPVVILTSSDEEHDIERCYRLGANSYVRKPVDYDEFVKGVQRMAEYWLQLNVAPKLASTW